MNKEENALEIVCDIGPLVKKKFPGRLAATTNALEYWSFSVTDKHNLHIVNFDQKMSIVDRFNRTKSLILYFSTMCDHPDIVMLSKTLSLDKKAVCFILPPDKDIKQICLDNKLLALFHDRTPDGVMRCYTKILSGRVENV